MLKKGAAHAVSGFQEHLAECAALCEASDYSNSLLTDSLKWMRLIASANSGATVRTLIFGRCLCGGRGMLSVTTTCLSGASRSRSIAGPQRTAWVAHA